MKRTLSMVATLALAAALGLTGSTAASARGGADDRDLRPDRPVYLALGDSLAAGQASVPAKGSVERTLARWKANGFVAQFHETLRDDLDCRDHHGDDSGDDRRDRKRDRRGRDGCRHLQLLNLSRTGIPGVPNSGVTTTTVLAEGDQLDQAVALLADRNGDRSPRNDVEVVSLTVGGNDLFGPAVAACVESPQPATTCAPALAVVFRDVGLRYEQILTELRAAGGDDVVLLTTTYDNPLPFCDRGAANPAAAAAIGDLVLEGGTLPGVGTLPAGFNDVIRGVSARHGATAVDTFGVLGTGDFVGGADCLHPDGDGHRKIADVFAATFPG